MDIITLYLTRKERCYFFMLSVYLKKESDKPRLIHISPELIVPNKYQPRKEFNEEKLLELARSIKEHGILQPLTVKQIEKDLYELVAGERRLRAAKLIGLTTVPVIVKRFTREDSMVLSIIENIQRHDLSYFEEADSYRKLIEECNLTQEELAKKLGKNQSTVANKLRLLKLDANLRQLLLDNNLTERHARCLLKLDDSELREKAVNEIISKNLNVAQTEGVISNLLGEVKKENKKHLTKLRCVSLFKDLRIFSSISL